MRHGQNRIFIAAALLGAAIPLAVGAQPTVEPVAAEVAVTVEVPAVEATGAAATALLEAAGAVVDTAVLTAEAGVAIAAHDAALADGSVTADEAIVLALDLPAAAERARAAGAEAEEVREAIEALAESTVPAHEAARTLEETVTAEVEHGRIDSFGDFVRARLGEGLRGRELAAAIRAEHAARGHGRGHAAPGEPGGPPEGRGPAGERGPDGERGPEGRGPDGERGPEGRGPAGAADEARVGGPPGGRASEGERGGPPEGRGPEGERGPAAREAEHGHGHGGH